ncbi:hypothetical protein QZM99_36755, partial [Burkholderia gladioli]|nr:hypothetical protein [Burkholderia gladioli]
MATLLSDPVETAAGFPAPADEAALDALLASLAPALAEGAARHDLDGSFAHEHLALLHRHGLVAQVVPQRLGPAAVLAHQRAVLQIGHGQHQGG